MADYKATTISGTSYQRASRVVIANPLGGTKSISFDEEKVVIIGTEQFVSPMTNLLYGLTESLTPENVETTFPVLDASGEPTGLMASYADVYLLISSLYYHLAAERDNAA